MTTFVHRGDDASGAIFSACGLYRFELWRQWDSSKPTAMFTMLNPSTATHEIMDPTVTRCRGYAEAWGYGRLLVMNIFAYRATDPKEMKAAIDPVGYRNDMAISQRAIEVTAEGGVVVAAWGTHGAFRMRGEEVRAMFRRYSIPLHYLKLSKAGHPGHPLYLKADLKPQVWS